MKVFIGFLLLANQWRQRNENKSIVDGRRRIEDRSLGLNTNYECLIIGAASLPAISYISHLTSMKGRLIS